MPGKLSPSGFDGSRPHHSELSGIGIPHGTPFSWSRSSGIPPEADSSLHQGISARSTTKPVKHKTPELQPTPVVFPQNIHRERSIGQDPDDIIDLTLDSSDVEFFNTEPTSNKPSINGLSMSSTILGPALNLAKEPHDKPRSFVRYTLDFEPGLVNVSAHGFVDRISVVPRW